MPVVRNKKIGVPAYEEFVFTKKQHDFCLLIPIFNEAKNFPAQIEKMRRLGVFNLVDVVVCDAGSTDGGTDLKNLQKNGFRAVLIRRGFGRYSTDLRMGFDWLKRENYRGVITVDGTNKDDLAATARFVQKLNEGYVYIQGSRFLKGGKAKYTPWWRTLSIRAVADPLVSLSAGKFLSDTTNGFRAYSSEIWRDGRIQVFREIFYLYELNFYLPARITRLGYQVTQIPVRRNYPQSGRFATHSDWKTKMTILQTLFLLLFKFYDPKEI